MNSNDLCFLSASELSHLIKSGEVSCVEVASAHLERCEALEPVLNSFITFMPEAAMEAARHADAEIASGQYRGPLHGIPIGLKDLFYVKGVKNTSGVRIYDGFTPDYDSDVAARFQAAGAVLLGKLNLHPLAYGPQGENPDYGDMHNPWDPSRIAGGSSGGSGSATASGQCVLSMGTDTGGSVRIPSSLCGLVGLKPTYGRLSLRGITPLSWSLDHPGPMTRTVEDCALVMNALTGHDPASPASPDYTAGLAEGIKGLRVGIVKEFFDEPLDNQVESAVQSALKALEDLGADVSEASWPIHRHSMSISTTILMAESAAFHRKLLAAHGPELPPAVRLRLEAGLFVSGADYVEAQRARTLFLEETRRIFEEFDILVGPTLPITAHAIGAGEVQIGDVTLASTPALTQYTRPFNLNGNPAVTVPCGFSDEGLPIGLQLAGRPFEEGTTLRAAYAYELATDWHKRRPPL